MNKINKSIELYKEAKLHMPGGVNSPVRAFKNINGNPIFFKKAKGPYLIDADNNKYIDYIGSWGPMILGHSNPKIIKAVSRQLELGTSYGAPTSIESDTAKLIKKCFPSIQKIRMVNSGTEATMSAVRLARGYTNKTKIIKFDGCYHGHVDSLLIKAGSGVSTFGLPDSPGIPNELAKKTLSCEFNNKDSFLKIFNKVKNDLAAVIVEPIAGNMGFVPGDKSFLKLLRKKTSENNSLLIFDEVMTGFRVAKGGAQEIFGVSPDLTTLGKIIGGGLPVGAYGGKKEIMDMLAPNGPVYQAGTLSGNPLAMTAGLTVLNMLNQNVYDKLEIISKKIENGWNKNIIETNTNAHIARQGSMLTLFFSDKNEVINYDDALNLDVEKYAIYFKKMLEMGVYLPPSQYECLFLSSVIDQDDIEKLIISNRIALENIKDE